MTVLELDIPFRNPVYQLWDTCVSEHVATPKGFVHACTLGPARGADEGLITGVKDHSHEPGDINQGLLALPPHCLLHPASYLSSS